VNLNYWAVRLLLFSIFLILVCFTSCMKDMDLPGTQTIPVIYSTDLSHPHDDPDDHFDIVALYALGELEVLGIVLDQGKRQDHSPGRIPVEQMNALTGRNVPCAVGLSDPLQTPDDAAADQEAKYQGGVELIIESLESSPNPVTLITVGSLRDTAAAFNRRPDLFRKKASRLLIFIGEASAGTREWNVGLDPNAFIRIMNSGLPVWWVPCFDGGNFKNRGKASYWTAEQAELLREAPDRVMNFFIYALLKKSQPGRLEFLHGEVDPEEKAQVLSGQRRLWCTAVFCAAAGRIFVEREGEFFPVPEVDTAATDLRVKAFHFLPVSLFVDENANVVYEESPRSHVIHRYEIGDSDRYGRIMTSVTQFLINNVLAGTDPSPRRE
jgi:hypothetical protein